MQAINIRNLYRLFGHKVVFIFGLVLLCSTAKSQVGGTGNYNYFEFQQKPYYFGITLGLNNSSFVPFRSEAFIYSDSIQSIQSIKGPGFNLGIVTNLKIGDYFDFRFLPTLSFGERKLIYDKTSRNSLDAQRSVQSVFAEMPFHFRYKSAPYKDKRLFVIVGVKYSFDVASDSRARQAESLVNISPHDFSMEYGAGIQFFFPYFIFSPELKFTHGIGNTLIFNPDLEESTVLEKVLSRAFTVSLHFEG